MLTGNSHEQHIREVSCPILNTVKGRRHSGKGQCVELLTVLSDGAIKHIKVYHLILTKLFSQDYRAPP